MNDSVASKASNDAEESFDGFLVSRNRKLANKQLKELNSLKVQTVFGLASKPEQQRLWNGLMKKKRKNTKLLRIATQGSQYYMPSERIGLSWNEWLARLNELHLVDEIILSTKPGKNTKSKSDKYTLLSWLGANVAIFADHYVYQGNSLQKDLKTLYPEMSDEMFVKIGDEWNKICRCHKYLLRVKQWRERYGIKQVNKRMAEKVPMRERYNAIIANIASIHPLRWSRALPTFQQKMATRMRPDGECLGIELEFLANKDADILNWDCDDYYNHPFLHFKGDGSISAQQGSESLARFQELTYFMNSNSSEDWGKMKSVLDGMVKSGAKVNSSCGNHVHLDMRHRTHSSALRTATKVREAINNWGHRLVSYQRSNNSYCGINREHVGNRYTAVNIQCLGEHNTVEIRLGMPTLNFYKLKYWSQFLQYLATPRTGVATFEDLMQSDAPVDLKHYAFKRILKFQDTYISNGLSPLHNFNNYTNAFNHIDGSVE